MKRVWIVVIFFIISFILISGCTSSKAQSVNEQAITETTTKTTTETPIITATATSTQSTGYSPTSSSNQDFVSGDFIVNNLDSNDIKLVSKVTDSKYGLYSLFYDEYGDPYVIRDTETYSQKSSVNDKYQFSSNIESLFIPVKIPTTREIVKFLIVESDSEMITDPQPLCDCDADYLSCYDFSNWADAQKCFVYCKSLGKEDIRDLDRDKDNCACEYNDKCPCT